MEPAKPETAHNEQIKLLAAAVDRAGSAAWSVGVFTPVGALYLKPDVSVLPVAAGTICWILLAVILHIEAQRVLRRLVQ